MIFEVKVNNGVLKRGNYLLRLNDELKEKINTIRTYNELQVIHDTLDKDHKQLITKKLSMRDEMGIHMNIKKNIDILLIDKKQRGSFTTLYFKL
jgi:hypothetical protein